MLSNSLIEEVELCCENDESYLNTYKKVRGKIKKYADVIKVPFEKVQIGHVFNDRGEISKKFLNFLGSMIFKKGSTGEKSKKYYGEICSNLKRLISKIFSQQKIKPKTCSPLNERFAESISILEQQSPKWTNKIIEALPRKMIFNGRIKPKSEAHNQLALSENSVILLDITLKTIESYKITSLEELLNIYSKALREEIKRRYFGNQRKNLIRDLSRLLNKIGYRRQEDPPRSIKFANWSPKFRRQWERFLSVTKSESLSSHSKLIQAALKFKIDIKPLKPITIDTYEHKLGAGFLCCNPLPENWGVEDLLKLQTRAATLEGIKQDEFYNVYIDGFYTRDINQITDSKRAGYNSKGFLLFASALKSVAACNGIFEYHESFSKAYPYNIDKEKQKQKKDRKKQLFPISEIDENIERLGLEFYKLVKDKAFKHLKGFPSRTSDKAMRLCLFFPMLVALRYLGVRQKNIRNFQIMLNPEDPHHPDGNIGFRRDGTLVIHYEKNETKNLKAIHHEFNLREHGEMCGTLIRVLKTYHDKVYPYIEENSAVPLDRQFFAYPSEGNKGFVPYFDSASVFRGKIEAWADEFLYFNKITPENYEKINPHFFRGVCTDWLINYCQLSIDEAAIYLADDPYTLKNEYLDRNRIHNATRIVASKNKILTQKSDEEWRDDLFNYLVDFRRQVASDNQEILFLRRKIIEQEKEIKRLRNLE